MGRDYQGWGLSWKGVILDGDIYGWVSSWRSAVMDSCYHGRVLSWMGVTELSYGGGGIVKEGFRVVWGDAVAGRYSKRKSKMYFNEGGI